ncbi:MAG: D-alanyl-lipoteichoic acid biosynthesis protein DltB [Streptococcaceae bacterium]|jgi:membrane protein involved in D-alanine export|nr:D-alanyl-lipoteichoic acid biosynthesis protein DltB [Streptococcaceae bacterium]
MLHFPSFQPYGTPFYFVVLGFLLIPLIIARSYGKRAMPYQVFLTVGLLYATFAGKLDIWSFLGWGLVMTLLTKAYSLYRTKRNNSLIFYLAILCAIFPLFIVKLWPVISPSAPNSILGFLGISYITFKVVSTLMEIRDGLIKTLPLKDFIYFLYFFPTISSGPIDRFRRFQKELQSPVTIEGYADYVRKGLNRIFLGFLYNFIIGYLIDTYWLHPAAIHATLHPSFVTMLFAMYSYGLYLFFNFAGYSLFAVGVSNIMGYNLPMNFRYPFIAKNIKDFWNRWHMTLCNWFRDFVFMRLVKTMMQKKLSQNMSLISNLATLALFGLMGFWHGFTWFYILYGFYHAALMIAYDTWTRFKQKRKLKVPDTKLIRLVSIVVTVQLVFVGFLIFSGIPNYALQFSSTHLLPNF